MFGEVSCPNAERIAERGFYLPSGLGIRVEEMDYVIKKVTEIFGEWS